MFSVAEKSQIQALDRTQPSLPRKPGRAGTMTHDYRRNGLATLFAALNVADGTVIARCKPRHRHQEPGLLEGARRKDARALGPAPDRGQLPHPQASRGGEWLDAHPRFHLHFTPTSSSWLNLVERYFAETSKQIRRGTFRNMSEPIAAINAYVHLTKADPKPLVWAAKGKRHP